MSATKKTVMPTDDSPKSIKARMDAVYNGKYPPMPHLASMNKKQMRDLLQSLWTLLDETGIQRRNETCPDRELGIYGRALAAINHGALPPSDYQRKSTARIAELEKDGLTDHASFNQAAKFSTELIASLTAKNAELEKALSASADLLDEVRTGEDFEAVCWEQAEKNRSLLPTQPKDSQ